MKDLSGKIDRKKQYQEKILRKFCSVCPYKIDEDTIISPDPPRPDIYLKMQNGQKLYFELVESIDESIAEQTGASSKSRRKNKDLNVIHSAVAFEERLLFKKSMQKFERSYQIDAPMELLVYFNQQAPPLDDGVLLQYKYFVKKNINNTKFRRIWVYDVFKNKILFNFPEINDCLV
mgnify:CR=1 FL=1